MECNLAPGSYGIPYNKDGQIIFYCITENQLKQILCHGMSAHGLTPDGGFYGGRNSEVVGSGIAIGKDARVVPSSEGTTLDAIQLGTGTNTAIKTFKIWDWTLLKSDGKIHQDRLDPYRVEFDVENNIFKWRYVGTETWYDLMDVSLLNGADGKPFTVNEWGNLIEAKITEIQNTVTTGRYLFVVNPYNLAAGTGDNRADKNLPASIAGDMAGHIIAYDGDEQAWYDFGPWVGLKGDTGDSIELRNNGTYIQYKATSAVSWINLIEVVDLKGDKGDTGDVPLMQKGATYIQYSRDGGVTWLDLIAIDDIQGDPGATGAAGTNGVDGKTPEFRINGTILQWKYTTDIVWINLYDLGAGASINVDETIIPNSTNPVQSRVIQSTFATKTENDLKLNIGDNTSLAGTGTRVGGLTTGGAVTPMNTVAATPLPTKEYGELLHYNTSIVANYELNQENLTIVDNNNTLDIGGTHEENEYSNMYLYSISSNNYVHFIKIISNTTNGILTLDDYFVITDNDTTIYIINPYIISDNGNYNIVVTGDTPYVIVTPTANSLNIGNVLYIINLGEPLYIVYNNNDLECLNYYETTILTHIQEETTLPNSKLDTLINCSFFKNYNVTPLVIPASNEFIPLPIFTSSSIVFDSNLSFLNKESSMKFKLNNWSNIFSQLIMYFQLIITKGNNDSIIELELRSEPTVMYKFSSYINLNSNNLKQSIIGNIPISGNIYNTYEFYYKASNDFNCNFIDIKFNKF